MAETAELSLPSCAEMRARDEATIREGTPAIELMERAGRAMAQRLLRLIQEQRRDRTVVLVGSGNNGGDGLVIARILHLLTYPVTAVVVRSRSRSPENEAQLSRARGVGVAVLEIEDEVSTVVRGCLTRADLIVDALLGIGQTAPPRGAVGSLLTAVAECCAGYRVAIDVPSGVNPTTGAVYAPCFSADRTLTVEWCKRGLTQYPARAVAGIVEAVSIGLVARPACEFIHAARAVAFPARSPDGHKGIFGAVLVVGGSRDMPGAPQLAALAALGSGAGIVRVATAMGAGVEMNPALMRVSLPATGGVLGVSALAKLRAAFDLNSVVVLGPGLGVAPKTRSLVRSFLTAASKKSVRVVLDADGLNALVSARSFRWPRLPIIITPHPGEAARLLGTSVASVQGDRFGAARALEKLCGGVVVLKGAGTIVYAGGRGAVVTAGGPELATAGSGDVLAGIIAALWTQGRSALQAATEGVLLHAAAGVRSGTGRNTAEGIIAGLQEVP